VLKGEQVCLRRVPDPSGRVLLDCAIGFRGDDDQFYGLRAADPSPAFRGFPELNVRVRVTGRLIPSRGGQYVEAGQIVYTSIEPIADAKPVTGTLMCLLPRPYGTTRIDKCRNVIKTDRGLHWGLDVQSLGAIPAARGLAPGDRISLEGDIVSNVPEDWHPWTFNSAEAERIEGVLKVRSLNKLAGR
jgi:hypothetical protein